MEKNGAILTGPDQSKIEQAFFDLDKLDCDFGPIFGDGKAAEFMCQTIVDYLG